MWTEGSWCCRYGTEGEQSDVPDGSAPANWGVPPRMSDAMFLFGFSRKSWKIALNKAAQDPTELSSWLLVLTRMRAKIYHQFLENISSPAENNLSLRLFLSSKRSWFPLLDRGSPGPSVRGSSTVHSSGPSSEQAKFFAFYHLITHIAQKTASPRREQCWKLLDVSCSSA